MNKTFTSKKNLSPLVSSEKDLFAELEMMNSDNEINIPDDYVIENILNYSKALSIKQIKSGAIIETVLN